MKNYLLYTRTAGGRTAMKLIEAKSKKDLDSAIFYAVEVQNRNTMMDVITLYEVKHVADIHPSFVTDKIRGKTIRRKR